MIYRITDAHDWQTAQTSGIFVSADLAAEGFIHCCTAQQVAAVANRYYQEHEGLTLLAIDETCIDAPLRWEDLTHSGQVYPHVYGPIPLAAVRRARPLTPEADGRFSAEAIMPSLEA